MGQLSQKKLPAQLACGIVSRAVTMWVGGSDFIESTKNNIASLPITDGWRVDSVGPPILCAHPGRGPGLEAG